MPAHRQTRPAALDVSDLAARIDRALPFTTVTPVPSRATVWCTDVVERVRGGGDPLAPWRRALATQQGSLDQPHIAAAFVLQWWCEVVAIPMAYAAELGPPALASGGAGLGFELAPGLYPHRLVLDPARVVLAWGSPDAADPAQQALPDPAQQALPDPTHPPQQGGRDRCGESGIRPAGVGRGARLRTRGEDELTPTVGRRAGRVDSRGEARRRRSGASDRSGAATDLVLLHLCAAGDDGVRLVPPPIRVTRAAWGRVRSTRAEN